MTYYGIFRKSDDRFTQVSTSGSPRTLEHIKKRLNPETHGLVVSDKPIDDQLHRHQNGAVVLLSAPQQRARKDEMKAAMEVPKHRRPFVMRKLVVLLLEKGLISKDEVEALREE
jgi:hypothetical protein